MQMTALAELMKEYGIVGAGGAGFPSYAKLNKDADTVILNCAECEPLFRLHRQLLAKFSYEILWALDTVREAVGAKTAIVAVKEVYTEAIEAVNAELDSFKNVKVSTLPEIYPAGDEVVTVYETTGRVIEPGKLPISQGVIVFNVETMLNTYYALKESKPVCYKYVTVAGEVKNPQTFRVPLGMTFEQVVNMAGGALSEDCVYINGGAMTGRVGEKKDLITKTTNAILVLPKNHGVVLKKTTNVRINLYRAMSSCCQCRSCTDLCSRNLMGYPIEPHSFMRAVSKGMTSDVPAILNAAYCSQCKLCEMYACPMGLSPGTLIGTGWALVREKGATAPKEPKFTGISEDRPFRTVPMSRLISRLGVSEYDVDAPISEQSAEFKELKIKLRQHIGRRAKPIVKVGDRVEKFSKLATCAELGAEIHSPIDGEVKDVTDHYIILKKIEQ